MVPQGGEGNVPVVMVHGATLTGKSWETTPDGRMGWDEYFVRKGHPVYVPDQVGRGRSGFNQAGPQQRARAARRPGRTSPFPGCGFSDESCAELPLPVPRPALPPGQPVPGGGVDELSKQGVPDMSFGLPRPNPTLKALSDPHGAARRGLDGHSQSGPFPLNPALLKPSVAKGLVLVEPAGGPDTYTDEQIKALGTVPSWSSSVTPRHTTGISTRPRADLVRTVVREALLGRVKAAGADAQMLSPAETGIRGNSHMIMQDRNSLQIADLILQWIGAHVRKK